MLGNKIYFIDATSGTVREGVILGLSVNEEGYPVYSIKSDGVFYVHFRALCFETIEEAQERLQTVVAINNEIKRLQKETNHAIDRLLEQLHGKPEYEHLTIKGE